MLSAGVARREWKYGFAHLEPVRRRVSRKRVQHVHTPVPAGRGLGRCTRSAGDARRRPCQRARSVQFPSLLPQLTTYRTSRVHVRKFRPNSPHRVTNPPGGASAYRERSFGTCAAMGPGARPQRELLLTTAVALPGWYAGRTLVNVGRV